VFGDLIQASPVGHKAHKRRKRNEEAGGENVGLFLMVIAEGVNPLLHGEMVSGVKQVMSDGMSDKFPFLPNGQISANNNRAPEVVLPHSAFKLIVVDHRKTETVCNLL
jgi:hypothetical protein